MSEAELRIKPRVVGRGESLRPIKRELAELDRRQVKTFSNGERWVRRLGRALSDTAQRVTRTGAGFERLSAIFDVLSRVSGTVQRGGRSLFDSIIGPNVELERAKTTFNVLVGDTQKAAKLIEDIRVNAAKTPFEFGELLEGSRRLLRLTGANVEQNKQLLVLSEQLAAINPTKTVTDAAEALLDAQVGEFERLKEFGIKLRIEEVDKAAKAGKLAGGAFGDKYLDSIAAAVTKQTGGRDIVGALSKTFSGRVSTLKDIGTELGREIGGPAFEILSNGLGELVANLENMSVSPEFRRDIEDLKRFAADAAKWAVELARNLPQGVRNLRELVTSSRDFVRENETILKILAGGYVANRATGGAVGRGLGFVASSAGSLASRALFGKGHGESAMSSIADAAATPVRVVNFDEIGGAGSLFGNVAGAGAGAGGGASVAGKLGGGGLAGAFKAGGASGISGASLGALGVGAGLAAFGALLYSFGKVTESTNNAVAGIERMIEADKARRSSSAALTQAERSRIATLDRERVLTRKLHEAATAGDFQTVVSETKALFDRHGKTGLEMANRAIAFTGAAFDTDKRGRLIAKGGKDALTPDQVSEYNALWEKANRFATNDPTGRFFRAELGTASGQESDKRALAFVELIENGNRVQKELATALKTVSGLRKRPVSIENINIVVGSSLISNGPSAAEWGREAGRAIYDELDLRE